MSEALEWFKAIGVFLKDNKALVLAIITAIGGMAGSVTQYFEVEAKEQQVKATQQQVTLVAEHLSKKPEPVPIKGDDALRKAKLYCESLLQGHRESFH